jgi:hypothetical protein
MPSIPCLLCWVLLGLWVQALLPLITLILYPPTCAPVLTGLQEASRAAAEARPGAGGTALDAFAPVTYNYSFFHLIFALASMYIAMLMTGWGSSVQVGGPVQSVVEWERSRP